MSSNNNDNNKPENSPATDSVNTKNDRRKFIKNAVITSGVMYAAPQTIALMVSDRAAAQSACPQCVTGTVINGTQSTIIFSGVDCQGVQFSMSIDPGQQDGGPILFGSQWSASFNVVVIDHGQVDSCPWTHTIIT